MNSAAAPALKTSSAPGPFVMRLPQQTSAAADGFGVFHIVVIALSSAIAILAEQLIEHLPL